MTFRSGTRCLRPVGGLVEPLAPAPVREGWGRAPFPRGLKYTQEGVASEGVLAAEGGLLLELTL